MTKGDDFGFVRSIVIFDRIYRDFGGSRWALSGSPFELLGKNPKRLSRLGNGSMKARCGLTKARPARPIKVLEMISTASARPGLGGLPHGYRLAA